MSSRRGLAAAAAASVAAVAAGCGFGSGGSSEGRATLTVTRDYGSERLLEASDDDPSETLTVIRLLDSEAEITTRYGGGFVQSIEGVAGGVEDGRSLDWFFYVNGIESPVGAAEVGVQGGDRIWWDHRDWTDAMRVPAVVGSWPEPFLNGAEGEPVEIDCRADEAVCTDVGDRLEDEGVELGAGDGPKVLVGRWDRLRSDPTAAQVEDGPATSGVFADSEPASSRIPFQLVALDREGHAVEALGRGSGLVAALRGGDEPPTWLVTGADEPGVTAAAELLDERTLRDRYAVAVTPGGRLLALPATDRR